MTGADRCCAGRVNECDRWSRDIVQKVPVVKQLPISRIGKRSGSIAYAAKDNMAMANETKCSLSVGVS